MKALWATVYEELGRGHPACLILVAAAKKGSPGTPAAHMLVRRDGSQFGTIGGGIMERQALAEAVQLLGGNDRQRPELIRLAHRRENSGESSGLICGGEQQNLRLLLRPEDDLEWVRRAAAAEAGEEPLRLEVTPSGVGWLEGDADYQFALVQKGAEWAYRYNFLNQRRIAVFGGGHCGAELAGLMHRLGYAVTVVEPRSGLFTMERLSGDIVRIEKDFEAGAFEVAHPGKTLAIVMTYSMATDVEALRGILSEEFPFVGLMGSQAKIVQIKRELKKSCGDHLHLSRVHAPIGLPFNSDTPQEIAVSVAAQILLNRENPE